MRFLSERGSCRWCDILAQTRGFRHCEGRHGMLFCLPGMHTSLKVSQNCKYCTAVQACPKLLMQTLDIRLVGHSYALDFIAPKAQSQLKCRQGFLCCLELSPSSKKGENASESGSASEGIGQPEQSSDTPLVQLGALNGSSAVSNTNVQASAVPLPKTDNTAGPNSMHNLTGPGERLARRSNDYCSCMVMARGYMIPIKPSGVSCICNASTSAKLEGFLLGMHGKHLYQGLVVSPSLDLSSSSVYDAMILKHP